MKDSIKIIYAILCALAASVGPIDAYAHGDEQTPTTVPAVVESNPAGGLARPADPRIAAQYAQANQRWRLMEMGDEFEELNKVFALFDRISALPAGDVTEMDLAWVFTACERMYEFLHSHLIVGIHDFDRRTFFQQTISGILHRILKTKHLLVLSESNLVDRRARVWNRFFMRTKSMLEGIGLQRDSARYAIGRKSMESSGHALGMLLALTNPERLRKTWEQFMAQTPERLRYPFSRLFLMNVSPESTDAQDFKFVWDLASESSSHLANIQQAPQRANPFATSHWTRGLETAQILWQRCVSNTQWSSPARRQSYWERVIAQGRRKDQVGPVARLFFETAKPALEVQIAEEISTALRSGPGRRNEGALSTADFIDEFTRSPVMVQSMSANMLAIWINALRRVALSRFTNGENMRVALATLEANFTARINARKTSPRAAPLARVRSGYGAPSANQTEVILASSAPGSTCGEALGDEIELTWVTDDEGDGSGEEAPAPEIEQAEIELDYDADFRE